MKKRQTTSILQRLFSLSLGSLLAILMLATGGCNIDGGAGDETEGGEVTIGLTDAEGDFVSYKVGVTSLTLTRRDGTVVETLPLQTEVDFAQYTDMTEFLTAATVPAGVYTHATLSLDYNSADIRVEDANGDAIEAAQILDEDGAPLDTLDVTVKLSGRNQLTIAPGVPAHLTLDFDLEASNRVDISDPAQPVVSVQPFLVAELNPQRPKPHRLRGPLQEVNQADGSFRVIIRPFLHSLAGPGKRFGTLDVTTGDATLYEIDGKGYRGREGLERLAAMPAFTATVVLGDLKFNPRRFEAREVYAGSSVQGGEMDVVTGNVIRRQGDTLTIKGGMLVRETGSLVFNDEITILLGDGTRVTRQLDGEQHDSSEISIGQRIMAFGSLSDDPSGGRVLDATAGHLRMVLTTIQGTLLQSDAAAQELVLDLSSIGRYPVELFDFSGSGTDSGNDADPDSYQVDSGTLELSSLATGAPLKIRGFVRPFGTAPADFDARTLMDISTTRAVMLVEWKPATPTPFDSISAQELILDLNGSGPLHHLMRGGVPVDLQGMGVSPSLQPADQGRGRYLIAEDGVLVFHSSFEQFSNDLQSRLDDQAAVESLIAHGRYDDNQAILTGNTVRVKMERMEEQQ